MPNVETDAAKVRFPPPFVFVLAVLLSWGVELLVPVPMGLGLSALLGQAVSALLLACGVAMLVPSLSIFKRSGQAPEPWKSTPAIIDTGIYAWTRNPMYVGMACLQACLGVAIDTWWAIALVPVSLCIVYAIAVRHEEAYLEAKFGEVYSQYKSTVRRWL